MRVALLCLLVSTPALAAEVDCAALRAGQAFEIRLDGQAAQRRYVMTEQYTPNPDGSSVRLWRIGDGRVARSFGRFGFTTLSETGPDRTWITYQGIDVGSDPYAGETSFRFTTMIRAPNGATGTLETSARFVGAETSVVSGCSLPVRVWELVSHPAGQPERVTTMRYVYAPELRIAIERVGIGAQSYRITPQSIATRFTPFP